MNNGFAQGRNQTINLPRGGYMMAPQMIGGYGGHDPYLQGAAGNPYTMGAAGSLGVGPSMSGGGYGFGSGPMTLGGGMGDSTQAAYNQARNANLDLESELKGGFQSRYDRGMAMVNSMGKTVDSDINRIFDERAAKLRRQFNPGMSTNQSTVMARVGAQNERERSDALSRAYDTLTARKLETDARLSGDALSQRERVTNAYPDIAAQAAMAGKAGEAQAPMPNYEQPQPGGGVPMPMQAQGSGGPSISDFKMTPAQQKMANRMSSYETSRDRKLAMRGKPSTVSYNKGPAPTANVSSKPKIASQSAPSASTAGISHSYHPSVGFYPAGTTPEALKTLFYANNGYSSAPEKDFDFNRNTWAGDALAGGHGSLMNAKKNVLGSIKGEVSFPEARGYGGTYDPRPQFGESQVDYLARVNQYRRRLGLGDVQANPFNGAPASSLAKR